MKKVAIVIEDAYSYAGTENICNYMSEFMGVDSDISIFSLKGEGETFYPYTHVKRIINFKSHKNPLSALKKRVSEENFDYVFVVSMGKLSFLFRMQFLFNTKIRKKTTFYSCEHVSFDSFNKTIKFLKIFSLRWYDAVVVLTDRDRIKLSSFGIKAIKINNPLKHHAFERSSRNYTALAVGRMSQQKGFDILLNIWSEFVKKEKNWILNLAGDGELLDELIEQANVLNIQNHVNFLGKVNDLSTLYKSSDIFLMTSRYEGLPMVLLEAKSWSLPVIAFDCPSGPKEIVKNSQDGFLIANGNVCEFLDALNRLSNSDDLIFKMSKATEYTSKEFDSDQIEKEWKKLISE